MKREFEAIVREIEKAKSVALVSHDRPDGDAIGSLAGLGLMIESLGKDVVMLNNDPVPAALQFLPEIDRILNPQLETVFEADLIIVLDSADRDRVSNAVWSSLPREVPLINIDHHVSNSGFGDIAVVVTDSPATGEIIYELAVSAGWEITKAVAGHLFAAISTDTGSFRYPNTTSQTYRAAAGLIDAGVDVGKINQQLYESYPLRRVECIRDLLQGMETFFSDRCAIVRLTTEIKDRLKLSPGDTEGVVDIIRAVDSVIVAVFFEEIGNGKIRVSSRSKDERVDVNRICSQFGGGGHSLAAGTRLPGPIEEAESRFLGAVEEALLTAGL